MKITPNKTKIEFRISIQEKKRFKESMELMGFNSNTQQSEILRSLIIFFNKMASLPNLLKNWLQVQPKPAKSKEAKYKEWQNT